MNAHLVEQGLELIVPGHDIVWVDGSDGAKRGPQESERCVCRSPLQAYTWPCVSIEVRGLGLTLLRSAEPAAEEERRLRAKRMSPT